MLVSKGAVSYATMIDNAQKGLCGLIPPMKTYWRRIACLPKKNKVPTASFLRVNHFSL